LGFLSLARWHAALACGTAQCTQPINSMSIPARPAMNLKPWTNAMGVYEPAQRYAFEVCRKSDSRVVARQ